jgi:hypothetical protein
MKPVKIAIFCPIGYVTGGPEALHQLCDEFRNLGQNARLIPTMIFGKPAKEYEVYDAPISSLEFAQTADIIITPENHLNFDESLASFSKRCIYIWWLSVDNSPVPIANNYETRRNPISLKKFVSIYDLLTLKKISTVALLKKKYNIFGLNSKADNKTIINFEFSEVSHISQSYYGKDFLKNELGIEAAVVSDYIRRERFRVPLKATEQKKKVVAYNYAKSHLLLSKIIKRMSTNIEFVPLQNMTSIQIRNQLVNSDLYLDMGHFPGRDRLPREAISMGCPVLLARRGAARYYDDFKLEDEFLFDIVNQNARDLESALIRLLDQGNNLVKKQKIFATSVDEDKKTFQKEVQEFLIKVQTQVESEPYRE